MRRVLVKPGPRVIVADRTMPRVVMEPVPPELPCCCSGGPPPPQCGTCAAALFWRDCGLGDEGCCPCAAEFHRTFDATFEQTWSWDVDQDVESPVYGFYHRSWHYFTRIRTTWHLTIRVWCDANGNHFYDWGDSRTTREFYKTDNGRVTQNTTETWEGQYAQFNEAGDMRLLLACYVPCNIFFIYLGGSTISCCASSGAYNHPIDSSHADPPFCASGYTAESATYSGQSSCDGGQFALASDWRYYVTADHCHESGSGVIVSGIESREATHNASGTWTNANDSICEVNPCPPPGPSGACCGVFPYNFGRQNCGVMGPASCRALGGTYQGDGTDCASANCPDIGGCCQPDGGCRLTTQAECGLSGHWLGANSRCPPPGDFACGSGACCHTDGTCNVASRTFCSAIGGVYLGDGTACGPNSCLPTLPAGACCQTDGSCLSTTHAGCDSVGGTYLGDGTSCGTSACGTTGACCIDGGAGGCYDGLTQQQCGDRVRGIGGSHSVVWQPGETCAQIGCVVGQPVRIEAAGVRSFV